MNGSESTLKSRQRAAAVANRALHGEYDLLLACRDLASLRSHLQGVPENVLDTFVGVASEIDDLPVGAERRNWSLDALKGHDVETSRYREEVRDVVTDALRQLLASLGNRAI